MNTFTFETSTELSIGGELKLWVEIGYSPEERQTLEDPGCPADASIVEIKVYNEFTKKYDINLFNFVDNDDVVDSILDEFWDKKANGDFCYEGDY